MRDKICKASYALKGCKEIKVLEKIIRDGDKFLEVAKMLETPQWNPITHSGKIGGLDHDYLITI